MMKHTHTTTREQMSQTDNFYKHDYYADYGIPKKQKTPPHTHT
jgi:hypothetical protein